MNLVQETIQIDGWEISFNAAYNRWEAMANYNLGYTVYLSTASIIVEGTTDGKADIPLTVVKKLLELN